MKNEKAVPIFFATDDNYMPFLDVTIRSIKEKASRKYRYEIYVLNSGLEQKNIDKVKLLEDANFSINFFDISNYINDVSKKLRNVYHYGLASYYRLFIQSLFPQFSKVLYLDCDIVVLEDISKLYFTKLENNMVAAVREQFVASVDAFRDYVKCALGINYNNYFNSGILLMDLSKFREECVEEKFIYLLSTYNFESIAPDQDYLNFFCKGKVKFLQNGWNKTPSPAKLEGKLNIFHYALYKKPWQYDDVENGHLFWEFAKKSPFYNKILNIKANFNDEARAKKEKANKDIIVKAIEITNSQNTFYKKLVLPRILNEYKNSKKANKEYVLDDLIFNFEDLWKKRRRITG